MIKQILIAIDQLINAIFGGWADETLSARCWRCRERQPYKLLEPVINRLFFDPMHCFYSYISERKRAQLPPEYRQCQ